VRGINLQRTIPSPEEIRQVTQEILHRPEFQASPPWEQWIDAFLERVRALLHGLALWLESRPATKWVVFALLGLLLVLLLVRLLRLLISDMLPYWASGGWQRGLPAADEPAVACSSGNWAEVLPAIRLAIGQEDGYRAVQLLHRYLLTVLDQQQLVTFASWKTNTDYLRECPRTSTAYKTLVEITDAYEQVVYAHQAIPLHTISSLLAQVEHD
jgi:hypothetical protein